MDKRLVEIHEKAIIAIIRLDDLSKAIPLTEALASGGITIIEFTLTNPDAPKVIQEVKNSLGDKILIGAGSLTKAAQVEEVAKAGAQFIVSPVMKTELIQAAKNFELVSMIGAYTPTEIQTAWEAGADAVKVFPARNLGPDYIKDLLAPLPHLRLIPTGGIEPNNVRAYIKAGVFALGAGGALLDKTALANDDWETIERHAKTYVQALAEARS